jgi:CHAT domain-containing protein/tetratricopeptide (TPR) repeat protein
MKTKPGLLLLYFIFFQSALHAQSIELNSLYAKKVAAYNQGDLEGALKWGVQAVTKAHQEFGENETYANYASDLGQLYFQLKKYNEAQVLYEGIAKIYEQKLGPDHVYTAVTNNNLGNIYRLGGKKTLALEVYKKALEGYRKSYDNKHEYYRITLNSLIELCNDAGFYQDLEKIYRNERTLASLPTAANPDYVAWTNNLAMLLEETGKAVEAEALYKECLEIVQKSKNDFTEEYPTLNANLGEFYLNQNRLDEAEKFMLRSIVATHASYPTHLSNLGMVYQRKKEFDKALEAYLKSLNHLKETGQDTSTTYRMVVYNATALYSRGSKYTEEIALLKSALRTNSHQDARLLNELGIAYERVGNYKKADSVYDIVMLQPKNTAAFSNHELTRAIAGRAEIWRIQGKLKDAESLLLTAVNSFQKDSLSEKESIAVLNHNLAYLYKTMGQYAKAEPLAKKAIAQHQAINGKDVTYANMVKNQGSLYMDMIQYERAEMLIGEAMVIEKKELGENTDAYSTSLNQLGLVYFYQGRYNESKICTEQSLAIKELILGKQHEHYANGLVNLANVYMEEGLFEKSEPLYRQAQRIYKSSTGANTKNYANTLHALSKVQSSMGLFAEARTLLLQTLEVQGKTLGTAHPDYANALNSLGMLYSNMSQFEKADSAYAVSLELRKSAGGDESYSYAQSLNNIAELYMFTGRHREALKMYEECLTIALNTVGKNHPDYATYLNNMGQAKFKAGSYDDAQRSLEKALALREEIFGRTHLLTLEVKSNLLVVLDAQGKLKEAEKIYTFLNEEYLGFIHRKFPHLTEKEKTAFYSTINYHFEAFQSFALRRQKENPSILGEMFDIQLATKALLLNASKKVKELVTESGDEKLKSLYNDWLGKREYLAKTYSLSESEILTRGIKVKNLEAEADSLERKLSLYSPTFSRAYQQNKISWKDIKKYLKPGEAAIEMCRFYLFDHAWVDSLNYAALIIRSGSNVPELVVLPNGKKMEARFLKFYRVAIKAKLQDSQSWYTYWASIHEKLKDVRKVYFAPDGVYNEINLNTLTDSTGTSLLDRLSIHVLTSTKEIIPAKAAGRSPSKKTMLLGRPSYRVRDTEANVSDSRSETNSSRTARWLENASFDDLPGTQKEVEEIATILKKSAPVEVYLGEEAREEVIKKTTDAAVLHIATHGFFISEQANEFERYTRNEDSFSDPMLRSGIVLAGVENFQQGGTSLERDDGILTALEVCNLRLDNTELVVMSACETGLGEVRYGEGVYGLQRAFRIAGAKAMIMSLWKVDDQATQEMMVLFYNNWIKLSDKRKAFEQAQIEIRRKYNFPFYWGAFVLLGE